jgi:hypothetical protein
MTSTGAQRYNARMEKIFAEARALKYANAYPKLVALLDQFSRLSPMGVSSDEQPDFERRIKDARALLRDLGEL